MARYASETVFPAPREIVYDVFADREGYSRFMPVGSKLVRAGKDQRQGVGAVHKIGLGPIGASEEIVELVPGEKIVYKVVGGLPVRSHIGAIVLADHPEGTLVTYSMDSTPSLPVPDAVIVPVLRGLTTTLVKGAAKESKRRAGNR